jgi:putative hydrolase of the HAD superfamily
MASETAPSTPAGLLVDWGGVLTSNLFTAFSAFCEQEGLEREAIANSFRDDREARDMVIALETGKLAEEQFERRLGEKLGVSGAGLIDRLFAGTAADQPMCDAVLRARRAGIPTGLISNSWGTRRYDRARLAEMFVGVVISGEEGIRKPAPQMYRLGAERIGVPAERCVFVDDLPANLKPAAELGMATVHHVDTPATIAALERLLGIALR